MSQQRSFWVPVLWGAIILTIGVGTRQSLGIFQKPIAADLGVRRELRSFVNAFYVLLMGASEPFAGNLADHFGTAKTVSTGGALYVIGLLLQRFANDGVLIILGCVVSGIGMSVAGLGPILAAIGRQTSAVRRSLALGLATADGLVRQFAIVPFASLMQQNLGDWHQTMLVLIAVSLLMIPLSLGLCEDPAGSAGSGQGAGQSTKYPRGLARGLKRPWLRPVDGRFPRLWLSRGLRQPASAVLYLVCRRDGVVFQRACACHKTGRLGHWPGRII